MDMLNKIQDILSAFSYNQIYDAYSIVYMLDSKGIKIKDFIDIVGEILAEETEDVTVKEEALRSQHPDLTMYNENYKCPGCNEHMVVQPVVGNGKNNVFEYKSVLRCYACGYEVFYKIETSQLADELNNNEVKL